MNTNYLKQVRAQLQESSRQKGWSSSQFSGWWSSHKHLHPREIQKQFRCSQFSQENPNIYTHLQPLSDLLEPLRESIRPLMGKYTERVIGTKADPISEQQLLSEMKTDLLTVIPNPVAVEAIVQLFSNMSRTHGKATV